MTKPSLQMSRVLLIARRVGGNIAVDALVKVFGGQRIYIPKKADDDHLLVVTAGRKVADAIMYELHSQHLEFPTERCIKHRIVVDIFAQGGSSNAAAAAAGISYRQARRIKGEMRAKKAQTGKVGR